MGDQRQEAIALMNEILRLRVVNMDLMTAIQEGRNSILASCGLKVLRGNRLAIHPGTLRQHIPLEMARFLASLAVLGRRRLERIGGVHRRCIVLDIDEALRIVNSETTQRPVDAPRPVNGDVNTWPSILEDVRVQLRRLFERASH